MKCDYPRHPFSDRPPRPACSFVVRDLALGVFIGSAGAVTQFSLFTADAMSYPLKHGESGEGWGIAESLAQRSIIRL